MANEEGIERFEISDYDLASAFNPGGRKSKKFTKNQQIYGVWADDESEGEEVEMPSKSRGFGLGGQKDYSAPLGFVKGGVQQAGKPKTDKKSNILGDAEEEEEEIVEEVDVKDEIILNNLASKGKTSLRMPQMARKQHRFAGTSSPADTGTGMGHWEKHTKGIGAKLLLQMGYEPGKGLGKGLQGRVAPVEAVLRKGRGAIGAYGSEKIDEKAKKDEEEIESEAFLKQMKALKSRKEDGKGPRKQKFVYKTMEEVIAETTEGSMNQVARNYSHISKVKVIDMTGPEQRVLSGYHSMRTSRKGEKAYEEEDIVGEQRLTKPQPPRFAVPELTHNLDMLVDMCEQDIITNATELGREQDRFTGLQSQDTILTQLLEKEEQQLLALQAVMSALENLSEEKERKPNDDIWGQEKLLFTTVETLHRDFPEEFQRYGLAQVSTSFITAWLQRHLPQQWIPLADDAKTDPDTLWRSFFHRWRNILSTLPPPSIRMGKDTHLNAMLPYDSVLWHAWFPILRTAVRSWDAKNAAPLFCCIQRWNALLPDWLLHIVLEQLVYPRLEQAVQQWDPMSDLVPLHSWVQPWIPLLGPRLETLYPTIRQKLAAALAGWHPSDASAHSVLLPWVGPMGTAAIQAFVARNIFPKLAQVLETWPIHPQAQQLDVWHWVMKWEDLTSPAAMADLLQRTFFPRWLQVLVTWLNHLPNYDEVVQWFMGWKKLFSPALAEQILVKENFARVLDLMNQAVGGDAVLVPQPPPVFVPMVPAMFAIPAEPLDFREMVERQCAIRGIVCVPLPTKRQHGRPVFKVGNQLVYFDKQVIFVQSGNGAWVPCSLQHLLDMAQ